MFPLTVLRPFVSVGLRITQSANQSLRNGLGGSGITECDKTLIFKTLHYKDWL